MSVQAAIPTQLQGEQMMMAPVYLSTSPPGHSLKICTVVFGVLGMLDWGISLAFLVGWGYAENVEKIADFKIYYGNMVSIPVNAGMIYTTAHILFLILEDGFPRPGTLRDLRRRAGTMLTLTLASFLMWITSIAWLVLDYTLNFKVYHACSYGFVIGCVVTILAGLLASVLRRAQDMTGHQTEGVHSIALTSTA